MSTNAATNPGRLQPRYAYALGVFEGEQGWSCQPDPDDAPDPRDRPTIREAREAVANWTAAATDHGHASFYGAAQIRAMRAYWLGILRGARRRDTR